MWVSAWTIQFMKHVLPRLINPRSPTHTDRSVTLTGADNHTNPDFDLHLISFANELNLLRDGYLQFSTDFHTHDQK